MEGFALGGDTRHVFRHAFLRMCVGFLMGPEAVKAFGDKGRLARREAAQIVVEASPLRQKLP